MTPEPRNYVGQSVLRREDRQLLLGRGRYIADITLPHMLHAAIVRSQIAHGRIRSIDISRAESLPGVECVITGANLASLLTDGAEIPAIASLPMVKGWVQNTPHTIRELRQPILPIDKVRHVGEAVAVVVASSRYLAEDAAELISVDYDVLPSIVDMDSALAPDAAIIHEEHKTNVAAEFSIEKGHVDAALARAPHRLKRRFSTHRYGAVPIECRGIVCAYDPRSDSITVWSTTQVVHSLKREIAATLRIPEANVRCIAPDVGGGFGVKGHTYPEDLLAALLSRKLGRPVQWLEDRREHFMSACHSRDQVHDVEVGFNDEGRILAFRDDFFKDMGAYERINVGIPYNTAIHLLGPYKIDNFAVTHKSVVTNKVPNAPYRGAGRPEATFAMERTLDLVARTVGIDVDEVRRRNMVQAHEMPYHADLLYRDGVPVVYDSGDYPALLEQALEALGGVSAFRKRQKAARDQGKYLGLGIGFYVEGTGVGPFESATVRIESSGKICVIGGACPQGQGMETIFAQVAADFWSVDPSDVTVVLGDSSAITYGYGTNSSRSTVNLGGALFHASEQLREKVFAVAAHQLECAPSDLELRNGGVGIVGVPGASLSFAALAKAARPGWNHGRPAGLEAGLEKTFYFEPSTVTWSAAVHVAIVDVDINLGRVKVDKYAIAHDCGVVINPMLVEGQIMGGVAQGLGGILLEEYSYDAQGQILTGTFMDYLLPTANDVPNVELRHMHSPSPLNPLGVKGVGEGGAIGPPAAVANAVSDAVAEFGIECNSTPIRAETIALAIRQRLAQQR